MVGENISGLWAECQPSDSRTFHTIDASDIFSSDKENIPQHAAAPSTEKTKRHRIASPEAWKKNIRKRARNSGEAHFNTSNKFVPKRTARPFSCKCNFDCRAFSEEDRQTICSGYWASGSYAVQREFIARMVTEEPPKTGGSKRKASRRYHLQLDGSKGRVCRGFFLATLDIGRSTVTCTMHKVQSTGLLEPDHRGIHNSTPESTQLQSRQILDHINSFPTMESHYCRKNSQHRYLDGDLNLSEMYEDYEKLQKDQGRKPLAKSTYKRIFKKEFNLSFHWPKKDACLLCHQLDSVELAVHRVKADRARQEKESDKRRAQEDKAFHSFTFDLQSVLYTPYSNVSTMYYMRKIVCLQPVFDQNTKGWNLFCLGRI